jgi:hypothetical protein
MHSTGFRAYIRRAYAPKCAVRTTYVSAQVGTPVERFHTLSFNGRCSGRSDNPESDKEIILRV